MHGVGLFFLMFVVIVATVAIYKHRQEAKAAAKAEAKAIEQSLAAIEKSAESKCRR